jgi:hypothetical protein
MQSSVTAKQVSQSARNKLQPALALLWRLLLAVFGTYAATVIWLSLAAQLLAMVPGWTLAGSVLGSMLLSFLLYSLLILWVFARRHLARTSLYLLGSTIAAWGLCSLLSTITGA